MDYYLIFIAGFMGSAHCLGMCGGFPLSIATTSSAFGMGIRVPLQLLYNFGRIFTYSFIGAVVGYFGFVLRDVGYLAGIQNVLAYLAGVVMILIGLQVLGFFKKFGYTADSFNFGILSKIFSYFLNSRNKLSSPFFVGLFNGFLPCGLVYAFLVKAASTGSVLDGMLTMFFFGLGTIPAMLLLGTSGAVLTPKLRGRINQFAGVIVILLGIITILRGLPFYAGMMQQHGDMNMIEHR